MLEISDIVNIQVAQAAAGLSSFNVNNLAIFTSDQFLVNTNSDAYRVYKSLAQVGVDFGTTTETYQQAAAVFSQTPNILNGDGALIIFPQSGSETFAAAIARCIPLVQFCGILCCGASFLPANSAWKALADTIQAYGDKIWFLPSSSSGDIAGAFTAIQGGSDTRTRCLYYSTSALASRLFAAAYAGKAMSTDFSASNGTLTMNLKQLATITADAGITETIRTNCQTAGVDIYPSFGGLAEVASYGANSFFDEVYNLIWFVSALQVAGFNMLAQVDGKIPQTEPGMSTLKNAYRQVCDQAVTNGYVAPGTWNSAERFGNPDAMLSNILQVGYYIYSQPVNLQSQADRAARKAPLVQIAIKEAGAIHTSTVVVNINQ